MSRYVFTAAGETDTVRFGHRLAAALPATATVALSGTLGAGKTRLVQALAAGCGVDPAGVTSPTFVLCQVYQGSRTIYHLDAYRVGDLDEFLELGVEELFDGPGLTCIEWADRVAPCLPADRLDVHIEVTGAETRSITCTSHGPASDAIVDALRRSDRERTD